jgi:hypothetical protein
LASSTSSNASHAETSRPSRSVSSLSTHSADAQYRWTRADKRDGQESPRSCRLHRVRVERGEERLSAALTSRARSSSSSASASCPCPCPSLPFAASASWSPSSLLDSVPVATGLDTSRQPLPPPSDLLRGAPRSQSPLSQPLTPRRLRSERLGVTEAVDHSDGIIRALDQPPIIMGHSFGGLFPPFVDDRRSAQPCGSRTRAPFLPCLLLSGDLTQTLRARTSRCTNESGEAPSTICSAPVQRQASG